MCYIQHMAKNIKDFSDYTISELLDSLEPHEQLELDRPVTFVTATPGSNSLALKYSFDPELFDITDNKLEKVTQEFEEETGLLSWYEAVDNASVLVCVAIPRSDRTVGEYFSPKGGGTLLIDGIHRKVQNS